jgi:hypothetical protein
MGESPVSAALAGIAAIEEAHVIAGVTGTEAIVALDTFFDRPVEPGNA